jgi:hypothetical protein
MAALWQYHNANLYGQNRYAGMSRDILLRRALELVGQMQDTLKQSAETTRQFQATLKAQEEKSRHLLCKWDTVSEIVQVLEQDEATTEEIKSAEPVLRPSASNIPNGVLHGEGLDPATTIEPMDEPPVPAVMEKKVVQLWSIEPRAMAERPLPLETKMKAPIQLWNSFVFQLSTKRVEVWISFHTVIFWGVFIELWITFHIVGFKHRWRWKLSSWRPQWVPLTGGRGLQHLARTKTTFGSPDVSRDAWVNEMAGTCFAQSGHKGEEEDDRCQRGPHGHGCRSFLHGGAWLELLEGSGITVWSLNLGRVWRSTWQELMAFWKRVVPLKSVVTSIGNNRRVIYERKLAI